MPPASGVLATIDPADIEAALLLANGALGAIDGPAVDPARGRGDHENLQYPDKFGIIVQLEVTSKDSAGTPLLDIDGQPLTGIGTKNFNFHDDPALFPGFPKDLGGDGAASPRFADIDDDGVDELIVAYLRRRSPRLRVRREARYPVGRSRFRRCRRTEGPPTRRERSRRRTRRCYAAPLSAISIATATWRLWLETSRDVSGSWRTMVRCERDSRSARILTSRMRGRMNGGRLLCISVSSKPRAGRLSRPGRSAEQS